MDLVNYGIIDSMYSENGKKCRLILTRVTMGYPRFIVALLAENSPYTEAYNKQKIF